MLIIVTPSLCSVLKSKGQVGGLSLYNDYHILVELTFGAKVEICCGRRVRLVAVAELVPEVTPAPSSARPV